MLSAIYKIGYVVEVNGNAVFDLHIGIMMLWHFFVVVVVVVAIVTIAIAFAVHVICYELRHLRHFGLVLTKHFYSVLSSLCCC